MNSVELINKIDSLNQALIEFENNKNNINRILENSLHEDELQQRVNELKHILESFQLMATGTTCPRCHGTGKI